MTTHAEHLPRYQHLRRAGVQLNSRLVKTLSRSVMDEGGRKLGLLEGDVLVFDTDDEMAVLMDFCIHDIRRYGANAVESYLTNSPPPVDSDDWVLLQALLGSWVSVFVVKSAEKGVGVLAEDILRGRGEKFLVDVSFGTTASAGMVMVMRVMEAEGIGMTTGAALPLGKWTPAQRRRLVEALRNDLAGVDFTNMAPEEASELAVMLFRNSLALGVSEAIEYARPGRAPAPKSKPPRRRKKDSK